MSAQSFSRTESYKKARATLVRHWIDLGRLSIVVTPGSLRISGSFHRLPGVAAELTPALMDSIFRDLKRVPGITRITTRFDNWEQEGGCGAWKPVAAKDEKGRGQARKQADTQTYTIRRGDTANPPL